MEEHRRVRHEVLRDAHVEEAEPPVGEDGTGKGKRLRGEGGVQDVDVRVLPGIRVEQAAQHHAERPQIVGVE